MEELRAVVDFPGYWAKDGAIISDWCKNGKGGCNPKYRHVLEPRPTKRGYMRVGLRKDGKTYDRYIHILIAQAFIPNPLGLPEVNHRNEDKSDNRIENLEWCTESYNINYGSRNEKDAQTKRIPVIATKDGVDVEFNSATEAEKVLGVDGGNIAKCCKGVYKQTGGYEFRYKDVTKCSQD